MNLTGIDKMKRTLDKAHSLQSKIEAMQNRRDALPLGKFGDIVLRPFANSLIPAIEKRYKHKVRHGNQHREAVEISGPFGLMCEYMIQWHFTNGKSCYLIVYRNHSTFDVRINEHRHDALNIHKLTQSQIMLCTHYEK